MLSVNRSRSRRLARTALGCVMGVALQGSLAATLARATGEEFLVELPRQPDRAEGDFRLKDLDFVLRSDTTKDVSIETSVWSDGKLALQAREVGRSIVTALPTNMSLPPTVILARAGERISIPSPHAERLPEGVYAEQIVLTISDSDYDIPIVQSQLRFYEVGARGVREIDSTRYSDIVEPLLLDFDPLGARIRSRAGTGRPAPKFSGPHVFDPVQEISSNGRVSDRSEVNEE